MNNKNVIALPASDTFTPEMAINHVAGLCQAKTIQDILIVGYDSDGDLIIFSSRMNRADAVFLLEQAKGWVMREGQA